MLNLITRRIVATVVTLSLISVVAFILIQLPPGDYVDAYAGWGLTNPFTASI